MDWTPIIWLVIVIAAAWILGGLAARIIVGAIIARKAERLFNHVETKTRKDIR